MLQRFLTAAVVAGLCAGLITAAAQEFTTTPLIIAAEQYEGAGGQASLNGYKQDSTYGQTAGLAKAALIQIHSDSHDGHGVDGHGGNGNEWAPEDGLERSFYTAATTIITAFGFSLILLALMVLSKAEITGRTGLMWGAAAFAAAGLAPALGLPPELPGSAAADLVPRQVWWVGTILVTGVGLLLALRLSSPLAIAGGAVLILIPHIIGAPHPHEFTSAVPGELSGHFVAASLVLNALVWSLSGTVAGDVWARGEEDAAV